jgi:TonB family protein
MASHKSYVLWIVCLIGASVVLAGGVTASLPQGKPGKSTADREDLAKRCAPVIIKRSKAKQKSVRVRKGEKSTGFSPLIAFQIAESGEVINAHVKRSSGIRDIDDSALNSIQSTKYSARPGCPVIESEASVTIDFR